MEFANESVTAGLLDERTVDAALNRTLWLRFSLGLMDPIEGQPLWSVPPEAVGSSPHAQLASEAADQSIVLLRNDPAPSLAAGSGLPHGCVFGGETRALPLTPGRRLAVIGPHANATQALTGNYNGQLCPGAYNDFSCIETPVAALATANLGGATASALGCADGVACADDSGFAEALRLASEADAVVLLLGIDTTGVEKEGLDRTAIALPGLQGTLALQVASLGKPTAVVLLHGGCLGVDGLRNAEPRDVPGGLAVLSAFYPGPSGARAISGAVFGRFSPSGRLPYTVFGADYVQEADFLSMDLPGQGMTYKYYRGANALWSFGFGLSFVGFSLAAVASTEEFSAGDLGAQVVVAVDVARTASARHGHRGGDGGRGDDSGGAAAAAIAVAQLVVTVSIVPLRVPGLGFPARATSATPLSEEGEEDAAAVVAAAVPVVQRQLVAFGRTGDLAPGEACKLHLTVPAAAFALADAEGNLAIYPGDYVLEVWDGSAKEPVRLSVTVTGGTSARLVTPFPKHEG